MTGFTTYDVPSATAQPRNRATAQPRNRATAQPRNRATAQPRNRATAQPRNKRRNPFAVRQPSPYLDNRPLLTAGKPETRQYKAMFFLGKAEIGLPSAVVVATAKP